MEGELVSNECLKGLYQDCTLSEELTNGHYKHKSGVNGVSTDFALRQHVGCCTFTQVPIAALKQNSLLQSLASGGNHPKPDVVVVNPEVDRAREEWKALESIQPVFPEDLSPSPLISFNEALQYFQTSDLCELLRNIQPTVRRTGLAAITHFLFGPPRLHRDLVQERDLVFAIAQCSLDNKQEVHIRVLQTVYKKLTGSRADCPRFGPHWETVGFQGSDPATDLRGTGFLGLMHVLYLVMDPETLPLARIIYRLSQHPIQNFPFSVMSINMTRIALHALREEVLCKECNRRQQVIGVINDFYVATFLHLYQLWKNQKKTISDSGFVIKEVELYARKNPKQILRHLEDFLKERRPGIGQRALPDSPSHSNSSPADTNTADGRQGKDMNFTGVCEIPVEMEGEARLI
ncbi:ELMO domain-containing protein 3 isoform X2 [Denticeps clupeoides]|uniref:ELMO domain-containing protein 3 isoform X2 n=1 Tax=Denticeps clupeoides TaxID=299321 RepID=UPI0010A5382D|nr:ELMO domain-containing protein 3 isoform X2 [Denticeps clupeoides]